MKTTHLIRSAILCSIACAVACSASAQVFESVGTRALGMGGAFVAVADDATGVYWNPAGLAKGPVADGTIQRSVLQTPFDRLQPADGVAGWRDTTTFAGFTILQALGVSYLRSRLVQSTPTDQPPDGRQQDSPGVVSTRLLATDSLGVTLLQSLLGNLIVGTTLKATHGSFVSSTAAGGTIGGALEQAGTLTAKAKTHFDLDVGVLGVAGAFHFGIVGRNLRRPDFGPEGSGAESRLQRQVRAGVAFAPAGGTGGAGTQSLTVAVDADLTRTILAGTEQRHVAAGVEQWLAGRRIGLRGGVRANTIGAAHPVGTVGASVALHSGLFVEGQFARGAADSDKGWSVGGRFTF
jgi:hypothetical protein